MVTVPERELVPLLAVTVTVTVPLPATVEGVTVSQSWLSLTE
ncbi:MAG: hypothetical protein OXE75_17770 [bacterium]|nr:hypothetical protein [bacterium]